MEKNINIILSSEDNYLLLSEYKRADFDRVKYLYLERLIEIQKVLRKNKDVPRNEQLTLLKNEDLIRIDQNRNGEEDIRINIGEYSFLLYNIRSSHSISDEDLLKFIETDDIDIQNARVEDGSIRYVYSVLNKNIFKKMTSIITMGMKQQRNPLLNILLRYEPYLFTEVKGAYNMVTVLKPDKKELLLEAMQKMLSPEVYLTLLIRGNNLVGQKIELDTDQDIPSNYFKIHNKIPDKKEMDAFCTEKVKEIKKNKLYSDNNVINEDRKNRLELLKSYYDQNYVYKQLVFFSPDDVMRGKNKKRAKYVERYETKFYDTYCFIISTLMNYVKPYLQSDDIAVTMTENPNGTYDKIEKYPVRDEYVRFVFRTFKTCDFDRNYMYPTISDRSRELLTNSIKKYFSSNVIVGEYFFSAIHSLFCHIINADNTRSTWSRKKNIRKISKAIARFFKNDDNSVVEPKDDLIALKLYTLATELKYFSASTEVKSIGKDDIETATRMIIFPQNFVLIESNGTDFSNLIRHSDPEIDDIIYFNQCCTIIKKSPENRLDMVVSV